MTIIGRLFFGLLNVGIAFLVHAAAGITFERAALLILLMAAGSIEWKQIEREIL